MKEQVVNGVKVKFRQVNISVIDDINRRVKYPDPPVVEIESKSEPGKPYMEANPNDPDYLKAIEETNRERGRKVIDTMIIMGMVLVDGMPKDDAWLEELEFNKEMTGSPDLSEYDLTKPRVKEFVYKKFVVLGKEYDLLSRMTGVTEEGIDEATGTFQRAEERVPDTDSTS